ncbi:MAG: DUF547 domain-containing protein [Caulobacterales bacterium]|nr:DUF547 domain-containing protein [Caulobacterales bacterium]
MSMRAMAAAAAMIAAAPAKGDDPHAAWDELLARYVTVATEGGPNRFDYGGLAGAPEDRAALDGYIAGLEAVAVSQLGRDAQFAFWANLYNAATVRVVVEAYPVRSIRAIRSRGAGLSPAGFIGPWKTKVAVVEGRALSLDDIEHGILRPDFQDPRVHYAVNCASVGCPNLKATAWRGETLNAALDAAARDYVNDPRGVSVEDRGVRVSRIYKWFREDFGDSREGVIDHLLSYAEPDLAARIRARPTIVGHAYDWALNDAAAP